MDTAVLGMLVNNGGSYGRQRMFGSIGFLLTSYGLGQIMAADNLDLIFWVHGALLAIGCTILSFMLPFHRHTEEHGASMWEGLRMLAGQRPYVTFLIMNVFFGFGSACFINFVGLRLLSLGGTSAEVGLVFALNAVTEIPVMFMGGRLTDRFGTVNLLLVGIFGLAASYAFAGLAPTPNMILVAMAMVGFFSGAFWMNLVIFANQSAALQLWLPGSCWSAQRRRGWAGRLRDQWPASFGTRSAVQSCWLSVASAWSSAPSSLSLVNARHHSCRLRDERRVGKHSR